MLFSLNFTPAELELNRQGRISDGQRKVIDDYIKKQLKTPWFTGIKVIGFIAFFALMVFMLGMAFVNEYEKAGQDITAVLTPENMILLGVLGVIMVLVTIVPLVAKRLSLTFLRRSKVHNIEGKARVIHYNIPHHNHYPQYWVQLTRHRVFTRSFAFSDEASLRYFKDSDSYRVFYVSNRRRRGSRNRGLSYVLSVENLSEKSDDMHDSLRPSDIV